MILGIIGLCAFLASLLTFFSGFGLGTILSPVLAIFFPISIAIALTAVVHLSNNLFKLALVGKHANGGVVMRFGIPAALAAIVGALLLTKLSVLRPWTSWQLGGHLFFITPVKVIVSLMMISFTLFDLLPALQKFSFPPRYLPLGGLLSGFFGGLSGHQGALRSAFLTRAGLTKESFIATGVIIACLVDVSRLVIYAPQIRHMLIVANPTLIIIAIGGALAGSLLGNQLLPKVTMRFVQTLVSLGLLFLSIALGVGIL